MNSRSLIEWLLSCLLALVLVVNICVLRNANSIEECVSLDWLDTCVLPASGFLLPLLVFHLAPKYKLPLSLAVSGLTLLAAHLFAPACNWHYMCAEILWGCDDSPNTYPDENWYPIGLEVGLSFGACITLWRYLSLRKRRHN